MAKRTFDEIIRDLEGLNTKDLHMNDWFLTWDKSLDELRAAWDVAEALRELRKENISTKVFDSGLGISIFRDNSTRTRFSFTSACNMLGLAIQDLDESKSQQAHGETVRETATMISFMADIIGIRDDMYIGKGHTYQKTVMDAVDESYNKGILQQRPTLINLQCDMDHPTQSLADTAHLIDCFGGLENLKGKKVAMTWAYSPSYGKPLSVPQSIVGLLPRLGMDVVLAHPEGYDIMSDIEEQGKKGAVEGGGSFTKTNNMEEAFEDADIVIPKSWAPFAAMEKRTNLYGEGDFDGIDKLEKELLEQNKQHMDWCCDAKMMELTKNGMDTIYMHPLPADIQGTNCEHGEVTSDVFDAHLDSLYNQASWKPFCIAAMIMLSKFDNPAQVLSDLKARGVARKFAE